MNMRHRPEDMLALLGKVQNLVRQSSFTTTYKFAVLRAICDLAIELPEDADAVELEALAERVLRIYWRQAVPYRVAGGRAVSLHFSNNADSTPVILRRITELRAEQAKRNFAFPDPAQLAPHRRAVVPDLRKYVLRCLQPKNDPFLYALERRLIRFQPGVLATFRQFNSLIRDLVESRWARTVERWTAREVEEVRGSDALHQHLFGAERSNLRSVVKPMMELQRGLCFFSKRPLTARGADAAHVDHFIPWSWTHDDSVPNLVLSTRSQNLSKSDSLPSAADRRRWQARNEDHADTLRTIAREVGLAFNPEATHRMAEWAYRAARRSA
jgi:5-methylcytosine-specific restriction endonuclease McrA